MPVQSFTPQKQYLSFSGIINQLVNVITYSTAGNVTFLPTDVLGSFIIHAIGASTRTDTLPSAASLIPLIEGAQVGSSIEFIVRNTGSVTLTIAVGAGGTANAGDTLTIATVSQRTFLLVVTALPDQYGNGAAYTLYSEGAVAY